VKVEETIIFGAIPLPSADIELGYTVLLVIPNSLRKAFQALGVAESKLVVH